jgi:hypothetical protein
MFKTQEVKEYIVSTILNSFGERNLMTAPINKKFFTGLDNLDINSIQSTLINAVNIKHRNVIKFSDDLSISLAFTELRVHLLYTLLDEFSKSNHLMRGQYKSDVNLTCSDLGRLTETLYGLVEDESGLTVKTISRLRASLRVIADVVDTMSIASSIVSDQTDNEAALIECIYEVAMQLSNEFISMMFVVNAIVNNNSKEK